MFHLRMLMAFVEPKKSNARMRSQEILNFETSLFRTHFICRPGNPLDKYMSFEALLTNKTTYFDRHLEIERDNENQPIIVGFIKQVIYSQKAYLERAPQEAQEFELDAQRKNYYTNLKKTEMPLPEPEFTEEGQKLLNEAYEYIQKPMARIVGVDALSQLGSTVSHQKDFSNIMNFLNFTHNEGTKVDFDASRTKTLEEVKKKTIDDCILFITQLRIYVVKKVADVTSRKLAPNYNQLIKVAPFNARRISKFQNL